MELNQTIFINLISKYLLPSYIIIGIVLNLINSVVFLSIYKKFKKPIYYFLKINSIIDASNLLVIIGLPFLFSDLVFDNLAFVHLFWFQFYHYYILLYVSRVLNSFSSFINLRIAFNRLIILRDQQSNCKVKIQKMKHVKRYLALFLIVSAILHIPNLFLLQFKMKKNTMYENKINFLNVTQTNHIHYEIKFNETARKNKILITLLYVLQYSIHFFNLLTMISISCLTISWIRKSCDQLFNQLTSVRRNNYNENKNNLARTIENDRLFNRLKKMENQTNKMILYMSAIYIINEFVVTVSSIIAVSIRGKQRSLKTNWILIISLTTYISNCSFNIFLYLK
jgi:hypothetical protein